MAFEGAAIVSTRNGSNPVTGWRQDLAADESIGLSITGLTTLPASYDWEMVGRPEGSAAGGAGPEPVSLGTSSTASFTVDNDSGPFPTDGTYIVHCTLNAGSPTQTVLTIGLARLNSRTTPDGRPLRKLGGGEVDEDTSVANRQQGYATMLDRWLGLGTGGGATGATGPTGPSGPAGPSGPPGPGLATIPINAYAVAARTLTTADLSALGTDTYATTVTVTLPSDSSVTIPVGSFGYVEQLGAGAVTFASDGTSVIQSPLNYKTTATQYVMIMWMKTAANTYTLVGRLLP